MCSIQFHTSRFSWTFTVAYCKVESNDNKASLCFRPFRIGKWIQQLLPTPTSLNISFKHTLISPSSFISTRNLMRILYHVSVLTKLLISSDFIHNWRIVTLYFHFLSSIWRIRNIWSLVDPLRRNPHLWPAVISTAYGVNTEIRILDKMLYAFSNSDIPLGLLQSVLSLLL
jgi:hypothetical protein